MVVRRIQGELTKARHRLAGINEQIEHRAYGDAKKLQLRLARDRMAMRIASLEHRLVLAQSAEEE